MHNEQKKSPVAVTTRTGQNNRNLQTAGAKIITPFDLDEQLYELAKMLRTLLDLIEEYPNCKSRSNTGPRKRSAFLIVAE